MSRRPLIAGNWKMNLNHLEAIAVTQKLAYSLEERDFDAVDVVVLPPFTDLRSVQTLVDGDRLKLMALKMLLLESTIQVEQKSINDLAFQQ